MAEYASEPNNAHRLLSLAQALIPVLTVVGGALWGLYTYLDHAKEAAAEVSRTEKNIAAERAVQSERESRTRLIEAQKPFLDKQLALYFETAQVVGRLVTADITTSDWEKDRSRFEELYWSELAMVEHTEVASAMIAFRNELLPIALKRSQLLPSDTRTKIDKQNVLVAALGVAHALRKGIEESWGNTTDKNKIVAPYEK